MGLRDDIAVYFGLADEDEESRRARSAEPSAAWTPAHLLRGIIAVVVAGAVIGVVRCLLDGETVTVTCVIEQGWLLALVLAVVGAAREFWDRRPRY